MEGGSCGVGQKEERETLETVAKRNRTKGFSGEKELEVGVWGIRRCAHEGREGHVNGRRTGSSAPVFPACSPVFAACSPFFSAGSPFFSAGSPGLRAGSRFSASDAELRGGQARPGRLSARACSACAAVEECHLPAARAGEGRLQPVVPVQAHIAGANGQTAPQYQCSQPLPDMPE
jgi:hypothetical protein